MKTHFKKLFLSASLLALIFFNLNIPVLAQTLYVPGGTSTGIGNSSVTGNVGVGTSAPSAQLHTHSTVSGTQETFFKGTTADAVNDFVSIGNATSGNNLLLPVIWGHHQTDNNRALMLIASTNSTSDAGTNPVISIDARQVNSGVSSSLLNRPIFQLNNFSTNVMTVKSNGFVGIGTTSPIGNFVVSSSSGPLMRVESPTASLHMAIATSATSYSNSSITNDAVLYNWGENMIIQNPQPGKSIKFVTVQSGSTVGSGQYVKMELSHDGKLGIGYVGGTPCMPSDGLLGVNGGIYAKSIKVELPVSNCFPDYVFQKGYRLMPLTELEAFIASNHHLPQIPTAEEVEKDGINVAEMDTKLLQKIEELTLYMIEMKKENEKLKGRILLLESK